MNKITIGRIVGYVLPTTHRRAGEVVPAIVTRTWGASVQLTPFVDLANDALPTTNECSSVAYDETAKTPRTWHWLPKV